MIIYTWKLSKQCCSNQNLIPWHGFSVKELIFDESHDWQPLYTNIVGQHCNGVVHVESIAITSKPSIISQNAQNETTKIDLLPLQKPTIHFWKLCWWTTMLRGTRGTSLSMSWPCGNDYKHMETVQTVRFESKIDTVTRFFSQRIDCWWITRLTTVIYQHSRNKLYWGGTRGINCNHIETINNIPKCPKRNNNNWFIATSKANYTLLEVVLMDNHAQRYSWNIIVNVLTVW
jgi:hypothetical protein